MHPQSDQVKLPALSKHSQVDSSEQDIVFGESSSVRANVSSSETVTDSASSQDTARSSPSESPTLYAPAPIRPLQAVRSQEFWQKEDQECSQTPYPTTYETSGDNDLCREEKIYMSSRKVEEDLSPMLRRPSIPPRHPLRKPTRQASRNFSSTNPSSPMQTKNCNYIRTLTRSTNSREERIRTRKLRDLQRTLQNIDQVVEQPVETTKVFISEDDVSPLFPTPPSSTPTRGPSSIVDVSNMRARSTKRMQSSTKPTSTVNSTLVERNMLSPVMLVAEHVPFPNIIQSCKPARLMLPERINGPPNNGNISLRSERTPPLNFFSDSTVSSDTEAGTQDSVRKEKGLMQKETPSTLPRQSPRPLIRIATGYTAPSDILGTSGSAKPSPSCSDSPDTRRKSFPPLPSASSASNHSNTLPSTVDLAQSVQRSSASSSHTSTTASKGKETRLAAKIEALERQNRLLEAALMAVLKTGGAVNGCPCGASSTSREDGKKQGKRNEKKRTTNKGALGTGKSRIEDLEERKGSETVEAVTEGNKAREVEDKTGKANGEASALEIFMKTRKGSG